MATKKVVITGCSSGIGLATAVLLAKEGGFKVIATMRNLQKCGDIKKAAGESLNKSLFIKELDVSKEDSIVNFTRNILEEEGSIDVLINNAGIAQTGRFESVSMEQMQNLFKTNFFGAVRMTQELLPGMRKKRSGHIVFISSILGFQPFPFCDFYVASKFAIEGLVGSIAPILRCFNISVTSVEPGPVKTSVLDNLMTNNQKGPEFLCSNVFQDSNVLEDSDQKMAHLIRRFHEKMFPALWCNHQPVYEVSKLIKKCILDEKPPVRLQTTNEMTEMAKKILVDPKGNNITDELEAYFK
ncbi:Retinol dehydrogenase 8 [Holothuria leucospilota]|uniref:Retinol dehydrogenase 8 n=1 Tax=Holothuria leucospilota TaxID=206669 RepID=A0A9Q1BPQ0_HOLLE|nr:Retinol dehydrogenase 8 [Holothuria leucospilota]